MTGEAVSESFILINDQPTPEFIVALGGKGSPCGLVDPRLRFSKRNGGPHSKMDKAGPTDLKLTAEDRWQAFGPTEARRGAWHPCRQWRDDQQLMTLLRRQIPKLVLGTIRRLVQDQFSLVDPF